MSTEIIETVSLTLPHALLEEARHRAPGGDLSAYVAEGLHRRLQSDRLAQYLAELDLPDGPLTEAELAEARHLWLNEA